MALGVLGGCRVWNGLVGLGWPWVDWGSFVVTVGLGGREWPWVIPSGLGCFRVALGVASSLGGSRVATWGCGWPRGPEFYNVSYLYWYDTSITSSFFDKGFKIA
jgi:hypothetical protein